MAAKSSRQGDSQGLDEGTGMASLWEKFEALNNALPEKLKLRRDVDRNEGFVPNVPPFHVWLMASNGAGLGFTGEGIRYVWPDESRGRSHNFWIRWDAEQGYQLSQRLGWSWSGASIKECKFNEDTVDHMIKCLVVGVRIKSKTVCKRRRWWFF